MKHWKESAEIFRRVARVVESGGRAAVATVVRVEGSAYRRPGARLLIEEDGGTRGSISGGCSPVGLDLDAEGPEQVAVSIVAELLAVRASREPSHLRQREVAMHAS